MGPPLPRGGCALDLSTPHKALRSARRRPVGVLAVFVAGGAGIVLLERPPIPMDVMCEDFLSPLVLLLTPLWTILAGLCAFGIRIFSDWARSTMAT